MGAAAVASVFAAAALDDAVEIDLQKNLECLADFFALHISIEIIKM